MSKLFNLKAFLGGTKPSVPAPLQTPISPSAPSPVGANILNNDDDGNDKDSSTNFSSLPHFDLNDIQQVFISLSTSKPEFSNLDVKQELRKRGFFATQMLVSDAVNQLDSFLQMQAFKVRMSQDNKYRIYSGT